MKTVIEDKRLMVCLEERRWAETLAICVRVPVGSLNERPEEAGITHLIEHLALKSTVGLPNQEQRTVLSRLGGAFDGETGVDYLSFFCRVDPKNALEAVKLLIKMTLEPGLSSPLIETEKKVIRSEIQAHRSNMTSLMYELIAGTIYPNHAVSRPVTGTQENLVNVTEQAVRQYFEREISKSPVIVGFVGNISLDEVTSCCNIAFPDRDGHSLYEVASQPCYDTVPVWRAVEQDLKWPVTNTLITFILRAKAKSDPLYPFVMLFGSIVRNMHGSPLYSTLRGERGDMYTLDVFLTANSLASHVAIVMPLCAQTLVLPKDLLTYFQTFFERMTPEYFDSYVSSCSLHLKAAGENSLLHAKKLCDDIQYSRDVFSVGAWEERVRGLGLNAFKRFVSEMFEAGVSTIKITNK